MTDCYNNLDLLENKVITAISSYIDKKMVTITTYEAINPDAKLSLIVNGNELQLKIIRQHPHVINVSKGFLGFFKKYTYSGGIPTYTYDMEIKE